MGHFLDGCGVDYVHWIPSPPRRPKLICDTPIRAAEAIKSTRIRRAMVRNRIESWEMLARVTREEFRGWRNYGEKTHERLVAIASANGYLLETWHERANWKDEDSQDEDKD